ncbi:MAG: tetratricopeptide repeat protein [Betaproteobacteria bacterium]|nr:tetratricopeptide repeat protein [Betaproteobacteria bacterium]
MRGGAVAPGLALGLVVLGAMSGCDGGSGSALQASPAAAARATGYETARAGLDEAIARGLALASERPDDGLLPLEVVSLYVERARLTGDYGDFGRAQALLDTRSVAAPTAALCLALARLHVTLHRLRQAGDALVACPPGTDSTEIAAMRADVAMHSGRYREAETVYRALLNAFGTPQQFVRLALLRNRTGSPAEAAALLEAAEKRYHGGSPTMQAWLKLQRGLVALDRGRLDEALALYRLAADALPGWWLVDEHIAEALELQGDARAAKALYAKVLERMRAPAILDALAQLERREGRAEPSEALVREARALHDKRLAQFPEAAAGHVLDHFLRDGKETPRALALARENFAARPGGDAAQALAKAWLRAGKPERAASLVEAQLAQGWDTAESYWLLSEAYARLGRKSLAATARDRALGRNPLSERMYALPPPGP